LVVWTGTKSWIGNQRSARSANRLFHSLIPLPLNPIHSLHIRRVMFRHNCKNMSYGVGNHRLIPELKGKGFFSSPPCPDRIWGSSSLLLQSNGNGGLFSLGWSSRIVNMTTHLKLVPRLSTRRVITPLPHTSSRRGTLLGTKILLHCMVLI